MNVLGRKKIVTNGQKLEYWTFVNFNDLWGHTYLNEIVVYL